MLAERPTAITAAGGWRSWWRRLCGGRGVTSAAPGGGGEDGGAAAKPTDPVMPLADPSKPSANPPKPAADPPKPAASPVLPTAPAPSAARAPPVPSPPPTRRVALIEVAPGRWHLAVLPPYPGCSPAQAAAAARCVEVGAVAQVLLGQQAEGGRADGRAKGLQWMGEGWW